MSRDLHLIRHAKSSWDEPDLHDHDRPLNARGTRAARVMGQAMAERVSATPTFFVSSARRARDTFSGLSDGWADVLSAPLEGTVSEQSTLYTFSWRTLSDWLSQCDDALDNLALIGHNPAMTEFINYLCPSLALDNLPTAGWVWLRFDNASWSAAVATAGQANVITSLRPKEVMGASL